MLVLGLLFIGLFFYWISIKISEVVFCVWQRLCFLFSVTEESGLARIPLKREGGSYGDIEITYSVHNITATQEVDYVVSSNQVRMLDSSRNTTIDITIRDDSEMEFEETFEVQLLSVSGRNWLWSVVMNSILIHKEKNDTRVDIIILLWKDGIHVATFNKNYKHSYTVEQKNLEHSYFSANSNANRLALINFTCMQICLK